MFSEMKLGRLPSPPDYRNLKLARYLRPELPTPPRLVRYSPAVIKTGGYGMLANDRLGCCVISAMMHLSQQQVANDSLPMAIPSNSEVIAAYSAIGGYVPGDPDTDNGCNMAEALKYWKRHGIVVGGKLRRIGAYASVDLDDPVEVATALWMFGGLFTGFALPLAAQGLTSWTNVPRYRTRRWKPGTWGGHAVIQSDNNSGLLETVTWGQLVATDKRFFESYCDEAWVVVSPDWLGDDGKCPPGFDQATLVADLVALG